MKEKVRGFAPYLCGAAVGALIIFWTIAGRGQEASICRVYNQAGQFTSIGSGALIHTTEGQGFILTCHHLFSDGVGEVTVVFPGGLSHGAKYLGGDNQHDLAGLVIANPKVPPLPIGYPADGDLRVCGFGGEGIYRAGPGRIVGDSERNYVVGTIARGGDSGGPLVDSRNQVCGVVWGSTDTEAYATKTIHLTQFVGRYGITFPGGNCANGSCARGNCPTGNCPQPRPTPTPAPEPASPVVAGCDCGKKWESIEARLDYLDQEIKLAREKPGVPGPPGPPGPPGSEATVDSEALTKEIAAKLEHSLTLTMPDGTTKTQTKPLSEPLVLVRKDLNAK